MARASKPNIPTKSTDDLLTATEVNAIDTAIDEIIDDYLSLTEVTNQQIASTIIIVAGKKLQTDTIDETTGAAGVTIDGCVVKDGLVADSNKLGGLTLAEVEAIIRESGGPTNLDVGAIADGQYLKRVGTDVVGAAGTAQTYMLREKYTVFMDGATCRAMFEDSTIEDSDTDEDSVIQYAITNA